MMTDFHQPLLTAALCLLLGGCASLEKTSAPAVPVVAPSIANTLGESAQGRVIAVEGEERRAGGFATESVSTGALYTAASGKSCKRLYDAEAKVLPRVVCQLTSGEWYLQRSLDVDASKTADIQPISIGAVRPVTHTQETTIVSTQPVEFTRSKEIKAELLDLDEAIVVGNDLVERQLEPGETLWSFAQRLTGKGANWHQIAEANGIDDARKLGPNAALLVPTGLLKAGQ